MVSLAAPVKSTHTGAKSAVSPVLKTAPVLVNVIESRAAFSAVRVQPEGAPVDETKCAPGVVSFSVNPPSADSGTCVFFSTRLWQEESGLANDMVTLSGTLNPRPAMVAVSKQSTLPL